MNTDSDKADSEEEVAAAVASIRSEEAKRLGLRPQPECC